MRILSFIFISLTLVFSLSGCGLLPEKIDETKDWSAIKLYSAAHDELSLGKYDTAIKYFEKLESRYPFGTYAQQAQMEIAYAYYRQEDAPQALAAIERFIKLHPNHPNMDYMYYLRGLINFNGKLGFLSTFANQDNTERDPKAAREALDAFRQLVERFPKSQYAPDASDRIRYLISAIAQYEVHVANYYYRRAAYLAAINRAQTAIKGYPDSPTSEEALFVMMKSYEALGLPALRADTERVLKTNFPESAFLKGGQIKKPSSWWKLW